MDDQFYGKSSQSDSGPVSPFATHTPLKKYEVDVVIKIEGLSSITGKFIKGAVASRDEVVINPHDQLFLLFTNRTHFEIWVNVNTSGKLSTGTLNDIVSYAKQFSDNVQSVLLE